jgi:hypothetical protein
MRDLNDLDPLPKFEADTYCLAGGVLLPESKRQRDEYLREWAKKSGEDWQPYKRDGQIVPHTYINGQGKLKTEGYQPPEPPETDIPIPCVVAHRFQVGDEVRYQTYAGVIYREAGIHLEVRWENGIHSYMSHEMLEPAEPQTQTASQVEQEAKLRYVVDARGYATVVTEDADGWIPHKPGDPTPVKMGTMIVTKTKYGESDPHEAGPYNWDCIIAWKPAT